MEMKFPNGTKIKFEDKAPADPLRGVHPPDEPDFSSIFQTRTDQLERFKEAFSEKFKKDVEKYELVEEWSKGKITWFFRKRK